MPPPLATPPPSAAAAATSHAHAAPHTADGRVSMESSSVRASRNEIEMRSRRKRQRRVQDMQLQVKTLEAVLKCLRLDTLDTRNPVDEGEDGDEDDHVIATINEFLDPESHRLSRFLRESRVLSLETEQLTKQRDELTAALQRRQQDEFNVRRVMALRWAEWDRVDSHLSSTVAHASFVPWSPQDIDAVIQDSLQQIQRFAMSTDRVSTGREFMGWSDSRRLDTETSQLQFSFSKRFVNTDASRLFEDYWSMQFSADTLRRCNVGYSTKLTLHVLQRLSNDVVIVRREAQYAGIATKFHAVLLMFRVLTPTGYLGCTRTIPAPSIQSVLHGDVAWMSQFHWTRIERIPDDPTSCRLAFCGSLSSHSAQYARYWMMEIVMVLVRGENTMVSPLLTQHTD